MLTVKYFQQIRTKFKMFVSVIVIKSETHHAYRNSIRSDIHLMLREECKSFLKTFIHTSQVFGDCQSFDIRSSKSPIALRRSWILEFLI